MSDDLLSVTLTICRRCYDGAGGECHTPGCCFWVCPAPDPEQAERIRNGAVVAPAGSGEQSG